MSEETGTSEEAETLENTETEELENQDEGSEEQSGAEESADDEEETVIGFGDEDDPDADQEDDSPSIKAIRARNRELNKQLREEKRRAEELAASRAPAKIEVGPKPTLESCNYDEETFEKALDTWKDQTAKAAEQEEQAQAKSRRVQESYTQDVQAYEQRKVALGVSADVVEAVAGALTLEQQAVAIQAAKDPAALVVALSKSPARLAELAKIDNPWKLAAAIARMEGNVKITTSKKSPAPNRPERGSASMQSLDSDKELMRLEKEAEKSGNRTAVIAYKKQLKAKG